LKGHRRERERRKKKQEEQGKEGETHGPWSPKATRTGGRRMKKKKTKPKQKRNIGWSS
jgi:hypothetical protein